MSNARKTVRILTKEIAALCMEKGVLTHQPMTEDNARRISELNLLIEAKCAVRCEAEKVWLNA
jgi:hypothetical protein